MKNPFPGLNPYLVDFWRDAHARLVTRTAEIIAELLPADLRARIDERVLFEETDDTGATRGRAFFPDLTVTESPHLTGARPAAQRGAATLTAGPEDSDGHFITHYEPSPMSEGFVEIREARRGGKVVTVIEFVNPANKDGGAGEEVYKRKRNELLAGRVSLVELDWVPGRHVVTAPLSQMKVRSARWVCITRGWEWKTSEVFTVSPAKRLPVIPIPLRQGERELTLDLQDLHDQCSARGAYLRDSDPGVDPSIIADPDERAWLDALLKRESLRS